MNNKIKWILGFCIGIVLMNCLIYVLIDTSETPEKQESTRLVLSDTTVSVQDEQTFEDLEKVFDCMEQTDNTKVIEEYMKCSMDKCLMVEDSQFDECINKCIIPVEKEFNKLATNPQFKLCMR